MSEIMERGVLTMPYELAMGDELSRMQFWSRVQLAYKELEQLRAEREADRAAMREALEVMQIASAHWPFPKKREAAIEKLKARSE